MYRLAFQGRLAARPPRLVREPRLLIGRAPDCHLRLTEDGVLDHHALIERREDGFHVSPLAETSATRVNGRQIHDYRLRHGDVVEIGPVSLRFELSPADGPARRRPDWLLVFTAFGVALVVLGQVAVVVWVLQQPRFAEPAAPVPPAEPESPAATIPPPPVPPAQPPAPSPAPSRPSILTRQLRIDQLGVVQERDELAVRIQMRVQVGEREVDRAAAAVSVQFFYRNREGTAVPWGHPVWLNLGEMKNFTTKTFHARFPGLPEQFAGCVVRTYYRRELQDEAAQPPELLPLAPWVPPP